MRPAGTVTTAGPLNKSPDGCGPAVLFLGITRGDTLRRVFDVLDAAGAPLPMGGVVAHATVKDSADRVAAEWASDGPDPRLFLSDGLVTLYVPAAETSPAMFVPGRSLWWDLVLVTQFGQRFTFLAGPVGIFQPPSESWQP